MIMEFQDDEVENPMEKFDLQQIYYILEGENAKTSGLDASHTYQKNENFLPTAINSNFERSDYTLSSQTDTENNQNAPESVVIKCESTAPEFQSPHNIGVKEYLNASSQMKNAHANNATDYLHSNTSKNPLKNFKPNNLKKTFVLPKMKERFDDPCLPKENILDHFPYKTKNSHFIGKVKTIPPKFLPQFNKLAGKTTEPHVMYLGNSRENIKRIRKNYELKKTSPISKDVNPSTHVKFKTPSSKGSTIPNKIPKSVVHRTNFDGCQDYPMPGMIFHKESGQSSQRELPPKDVLGNLLDNLGISLNAPISEIKVEDNNLQAYIDNQVPCTLPQTFYSQFSESDMQKINMHYPNNNTATNSFL